MKGLFNCSIPLVFTFLCATSQTKTFTLDGILDIHMNLAGEKRHKFDRLYKTRKKDFIENKHERDKDQVFAFKMVEDKCIQLRKT